MRNDRLIKLGSVGTAVLALCCFTPLLAWTLTAVGLASWISGLDWVLIPILAVFVLILITGLHRNRQRDAK